MIALCRSTMKCVFFICIVVGSGCSSSPRLYYLRSGILRATGKVTGAMRLARRTLPLMPNSAACEAVNISTLHPTFLSKLMVLFGRQFKLLIIHCLQLDYFKVNTVTYLVGLRDKSVANVSGITV
jgi:hypothetical protein